MKRLRRRPTQLLAVLLGAVLLAGCGGGAKNNGIDKLSANAALAKVKAAAASAKTVHVIGQFVQPGLTLTVDFHLGDNRAEGVVHLGGGEMDLRLVDGVTYYRGDSKVYAAIGASSSQASRAVGRWIKDSGLSGPAANFSAFLDRKKMFDELLTPQGTVSTGGTTTVDGRKALIIVDSSSDGGKLYAATTGAAVPLRIERTGSTGGRLDFSEYDVAFKVQAPAGAVDVSQLSGG